MNENDTHPFEIMDDSYTPAAELKEEREKNVTPGMAKQWGNQFKENYCLYLILQANKLNKFQSLIKRNSKPFEVSQPIFNFKMTVNVKLF